MRSPKAVLLVVALLAVAFAAWAGEDAVAKPSPDEDKTVVVPAHPKVSAEKSDQESQPKPKAVQAPESEPDAVQAPTSPKPWESGVIAAPDIGSEPGDKGEPDHLPRGGNGGHGGGHNNGGHGWRGRHDEWRHRNYHGSWSFLWHFGPVIFPAPVYFPHVIRMPRHNVGVYVRHTGDDYVGAQFANSVREHLREQGLKTVYSADDAKIELYVVSMDEDPEETGYGSAVSVSYILYPGHKFITAQIIDVGIDEVDDLAQSVAGYADDLVDQYR